MTEPRVQTFTISKEIMDEVDSKLAAKAGMTLEEWRKALKEDVERHWCKCSREARESRDSIFHDDGQVTNQHCTRKHHWHCGKCKKLTQVG